MRLTLLALLALLLTGCPDDDMARLRDTPAFRVNQTKNGGGPSPGDSGGVVSFVGSETDPLSVGALGPWAGSASLESSTLVGGLESTPAYRVNRTKNGGAPSPGGGVGPFVESARDDLASGGRSSEAPEAVEGIGSEALGPTTRD